MSAIFTTVELAADDLPSVGAEQVRMLEAIGREGSISAAARTLGISYKFAWSRVLALDALAGRPLVNRQRGGTQGGGAALTEDGVRFVEAFRRLEAEAGESLRRLLADPLGASLGAHEPPRGFFRTSARNALRGVVVEVESSSVSAKVVLRLPDGQRIEASITEESLRELGVFPGRHALALIKAPFVELTREQEMRGTPLPPNTLRGTVIALRDDPTPEGGLPARTEVVLDIGAGQRLVSVDDRVRLRPLALAMGEEAVARFAASQIILATN